jgi:D-alanyl-D-alanine carboxypeptidase (penicillin-binding protein 5/6)
MPFRRAREISRFSPARNSQPSRRLYALLLMSSKPMRATGLPERVGGSLSGFAELMNERAKELGATAAFCQRNGLSDDDQYTTVYEYGAHHRRAHELPDFIRIFRHHHYKWRPPNCSRRQGILPISIK